VTDGKTIGQTSTQFATVREIDLERTIMDT